MMRANTTSQASKQLLPWQMPILPKSYPDRQPLLSEEEKHLMLKYATAPEGTISGGRAKNSLISLRALRSLSERR
jgi:hypothetical protein